MEVTLSRVHAICKLSGLPLPTINVDDLREKARSFTRIPGYSEEYRWQKLRDAQPACPINHIFEEHLGNSVPEPKRVPSPEPHWGEGWYSTKNGRVFIPEEFRKTGDPEQDIKLFIDSIKTVER